MDLKLQDYKLMLKDIKEYLEKAQEYIKQRIEEEKNNTCYDTNNIEEYSYEGYNEGEYAENHLSMYIEEKEIQ